MRSTLSWMSQLPARLAAYLEARVARRSSERPSGSSSVTRSRPPAVGTPAHCLGLDAEGRPAYRRLPLVGAPTSRRRTRYGVQADDLSQAGWGVALPVDRAAALEDALAPLLALRRRQAEGLVRVAHVRPGERAADFSMETGPGMVDPRTTPYYWLLVGGPEEISWDFQQELGLQFAVGRVAFDSMGATRAWAEAVVRREGGDPPRPAVSTRDVAIFSPRHEGDPVLDWCHRDLVEPLGVRLGERLAPERVHRLLGPAADRPTLLGLLSEPTGPSLLVTVAHGMVPKAHRMPEAVGALVCAGWGRRGQTGMAPRPHAVAAEDLPRRADLGGRGVVLFGCHTGGTPERDLYAVGKGQGGAELPGGPSLAPLPSRLLTAGASGVVAHLDVAYPEAFWWPRGTARPGPFVDLVHALCDGRTFGLAREPFAARALGAQLASFNLRHGRGSRLGEERPGGDRLLDEQFVWRGYHDARAFLLFGDPASRVAPRGTSER